MPTAFDRFRRPPGRAATADRRRSAFLIRRFGADRAGIAALEFAMVLPVLLLFYLSAFEGARGLEAGRKTSAVAETAGNLVTRLSSVSSTQLANIVTLSGAIMSNYKGDLTVVVTAVRVDDRGVATIVWSKKGVRNPATNVMSVEEGQTAGSPYTLPADLAAQTSTFFVESKATYGFRVLANYANIIGDQNLIRTNIFRPRVGDEISWVSS